MNTGQNLKKSGESYLGFVNRIWISNRGSFKVTLPNERQLVLDLVDKDYNAAKNTLKNQEYHNRCLLKAANFYERSMGLEETKPVAEIYRDNLATNCPQCAKIGYHSNYFNTTWLDICPVHRTPLSICCPTCNRLWAGEKGVRNRNCIDCGPRMNFKTLANRDAFNSKIYDERFSLLNEHFHEPCPVFQTDVELNDFLRPYKNIQNNHLDSIVYPSFVAAEHELNAEEKVEFAELGVAMFPLEKVNFKYESAHEIDQIDLFDLFHEAAVEVRQAVFDLSSRELLNSVHLHHKLLSCKGNNQLDSISCAICNVYKMVFLSLNHPNFYSRNDLFCYRSVNEYDHRISEPGILTGVRKSDRLLPFPKKISMLLYRIELWTQIRIMYYKLDRCAQTEIPSNMTLVDWAERNPDIASSSENYSFPYFVTEQDGEGKLYIPVTFLKADIETDAEFRRLIFPTS